MSKWRKFGGGHEQKRQKNNVFFKEQKVAVNAMARELKTTLKSFVGLIATEANIALVEVTVIRALRELMPMCESTIKFDVTIVGDKSKTMILIPMNGFTTALFNSLVRL